MYIKNNPNLKVTTESPECVSLLSRATHELLSYSANLVNTLENAIEADPGCVLARAMAISTYILHNQSEKAALLLESISEVDTITEREKNYLEMVKTVLKGDIIDALSTCTDLVTKYPSDLFLVKFTTILAFLLGRHDLMESVSKTAMQHEKDNHFLYGILAFALLELNKYNESETICKEGLQLLQNDQDPWLEHAQAHLMYHHGHLSEGLSFMKSVNSHWENCNSFMYTHNWWHYGLFLLDMDAPWGECIEIFDRHIWMKDKSFSQDQINAISFLLRMEIVGMDFGDRLDDVGKYISSSSAWHTDLQNDLLISYTLTRLQSDLLPTFLTSCEHHVSTIKDPDRQKTLTQIYLPCIHGMHNYALGQWDTCCHHLGDSCTKTQAFGVSMDQASVFVSVYVVALVKAGHYQLAIDFILLHLSPRYMVVAFWLGKLRECYLLLGQDERVGEVDGLLGKLKGGVGK